MLFASVISKNWLRKCGTPGVKGIFNDLNQHKKIKNIPYFRFYNNAARVCSNKNSLTSWRCIPGKYSSYRLSSVQAAAPANINSEQSKSSFQEMMHARKTQAQRSLLVSVVENEDIPFAVAYFEKYGSIVNSFCYAGEGNNSFLLLEFSTEVSIQELQLNCGFENIDEAFPVCSRIVRYERKHNASVPKGNINIKSENICASSLKPGASLSEMILDIYTTEKLTELDTRLRFFLCSLMKDTISGLFPHSDVLPFGSSVNGIGKVGCDLDMVIRLYPDQMNGNGEVFFMNKSCLGKHKNLQQRTLSRLGEYFLFSPGIQLVERILFARVPILKMRHTILNLDFDVSVNNISAIHMSDMLHFCGEVDPRVRPLMYIVKKWAKEANITQKMAGAQISNFGLANLVLFFLQTMEPHPILPPLNDALNILGSDNGYNFRLQYLKPIKVWQASASLNKDALAVLLRDFFTFLATFSFHDTVVSLLSGGSRPRGDDSTPVYVEYPLDEALNMTKNVSKAEYDVMCEKAKLSAKHLENSLKRGVNNVKDFSVLLGIPSVSRIAVRSNKFNISSVIENDKSSRNRNMKHRAT